MPIHDIYAKLDEAQVRAVDAAFEAMSVEFGERGFKAAPDDRAEHLVEAIAKYLVESNPKPAIFRVEVKKDYLLLDDDHSAENVQTVFGYLPIEAEDGETAVGKVLQLMMPWAVGGTLQTAHPRIEWHDLQRFAALDVEYVDYSFDATGRFTEA
jgi:hypothetical protein